MRPLLYSELVSWYRLVDPTADHEEEAGVYQAALEAAVDSAPQTLLELGCGAGNNAFYLKRRLRCTLTDLSPPMLDLSRGINPECEHQLGDMRSLRLGRTFDAVLVHDAVVYMTSEADLRAAIETAYVHTRPGGAALLTPDYVRETFGETSNFISGDEGPRSLRCLEWSWDPDPADNTYVTDFAFLLREQGQVKAVHDHHVEGLFSRATWRRLLEDAGFIVQHLEPALEDGTVLQLFLGRRPLGSALDTLQ